MKSRLFAQLPALTVWFVALCSVAFGVSLFSAGPASAHAVLSSTQPASGAQLTESPTSISLTFTEPVQIPTDSVQIFNEGSQKVSTGKPAHPDGSPLSVSVPVGELPEGGYVVSWRVVSVDAHPITGAFTFQVGQGTGVNTGALSERLMDQSSGSRAVSVLYTAGRAINFGSLMVAIGALAFLATFGLDQPTSTRARRLFYVASGVLGIATLFAIPLQALYGSGLPLSRIFDFSVLGETLPTRFGISAAIRLVLLVAIVTAVRFLNLGTRRGKAVALVVSLALIATVSSSGHATTGRWVPLGFIADLLHVAAAALWIGGLVVLIFVVMRKKEGSLDIIKWFSSLAFWCVVTMVVTGSFQGWRQLLSIDALWTTDYGVLLLVKLGVFLLLLVAANLSRSWIDRNTSGIKRVRRSVAVEIALAAAVIAITATLVNAPPARADLPANPVSAEVKLKDTLVDIAIDPARVGSNSMFFYVLSPDGKLKDVPELQVTLKHTGSGIAPLKPPLEKVKPGYYASPGFVFPVGGKWDVEVTVRTTDIDQTTSSVPVTIR